jgi:hypothetical protein
MGIAIESAVYCLMSTPKEETVGKLPPKPVRILLGVWLVLCVLPVFVTMFGYNFVPSTVWISTTSFPGLAAGLSTAALMPWAVLKDASTSGMKKIFGVLFAPFFGYFLGKSAVVIAVPMILALIAGHQVELPFTVERADGNHTKRCSSPVELQGLPFFFDRVCRVPDDFRQRLNPGRRMVVIGRGTSLGVYPDSLRVD